MLFGDEPEITKFLTSFGSGTARVVGLPTWRDGDPLASVPAVLPGLMFLQLHDKNLWVGGVMLEGGEGSEVEFVGVKVPELWGVRPQVEGARGVALKELVDERSSDSVTAIVGVDDDIGQPRSVGGKCLVVGGAQVVVHDVGESYRVGAVVHQDVWERGEAGEVCLELFGSVHVKVGLIGVVEFGPQEIAGQLWNQV